MSPVVTRILETGLCELKENVPWHKCQIVVMSANLAFDYVTKCEFKENVLRVRCQDANVSINLAFDYQSKCIILIEIQALKADRVTI